MLDIRNKKLAELLVNYSVHVAPGEKVLIEATGVDYELVCECIKAVYAAKGYPFVDYHDARIQRELLMGTDETHAGLWANYDKYRMEDMDCYIGIRGGNNSYETSDVPSERMKVYNTDYSHPVHHEIRVAKTKWVILRYPTSAFAQLAGMSTEKFENFYYDVCTLDYSKMDRAMDSLVKVMDRTDRVRIVGPGTDLRFSIKGIPAIKCAGNMNIPDGEVYTAPVRDSVNGVITYNAPSINSGIKFENVKLTFKDGKIVEATSNFTQKCNEIFDTDEGARYVGEFALGVNPFVTEAMGDILFDEKISGSIHFTPGACYDNAPNGNVSAVHWDLVLIQTAAHGGGEIWFDDTLIRKDGLFVPEELHCLNPENLK